MNKRFYKLVRQCATPTSQAEDYAKSNDKVMPDEMLDVEKFAEALIEECCRALNPMLRDMISRGQGVDLIKQHFKVEE